MFVWLGRCKLIMLYIACSEYEGFSFVYDFFGPIDAFVPVWKSSGLGHREILGESQSRDMKALRHFGIFWYQPRQVFLVSACFGIQVAQDSSAAAAWCVFCYTPVQFVCEASTARCTPGALTCFFALVEFGLMLTVGVSVTVTVGIVAARQLVSCIMGGLSEAAKASVPATAWPTALQGFLSLVFPQFVIVGDFLFAFVGLVPTTLCHDHTGSRIAFEEAKATPRVDVAETPQAPVPRGSWETLSPGPSTVTPRPLLVRALTGQTLAVRWSSSDDVLHCVSERTGVPLHAFYLTLNGKCLTEEALHAVDRSSPIALVMHGWLRGGYFSVPGDWVCSRCHIGGC